MWSWLQLQCASRCLNYGNDTNVGFWEEPQPIQVFWRCRNISYDVQN
jgi:hypothetical protein